jgi:hypothetical protein
MSNPVPMFGTQNTSDDDGQVIDSFFIETDAPPDLKDAQEPIVIPARPEIALPTRLMAGADVLTQTTSMYQLLPADPNRIDLHIEVYSFAASPGTKDFVYVADENGKISSMVNGASTGGFKVRAGKGACLDDHTGAIWIAPGPIVADNIEVSWRAVTR